MQPNAKLHELEGRALLPRSARGRNLKRAGSAAPTGCDTVVTPDCLRGLYNMTYVPQATDRNSIGIGMLSFYSSVINRVEPDVPFPVSYYSNIYSQPDLDAFFRNFSPALVGKSPEFISIDGGT